MTHKEFKLTANQDIKEYSRGIEVTAIAMGEIITVGQDLFDKLQRGETIKIYTREGILEYNKYHFNNEVDCTTVTVEYSTRKLGQRKSQLETTL